MIRTIVHEATPGLLSARKIRALVRLASKSEKTIKGRVEINIVSARASCELNRHFRGINQATDVLSFAWGESKNYGAKNFLGQLYLCPSVIRRQAKRFSVTPTEEFKRLLAHGLLHLVGHDHLKLKPAKKMFTVQEKIVAAASAL